MAKGEDQDRYLTEFSYRDGLRTTFDGWPSAYPTKLRVIDGDLILICHPHNEDLVTIFPRECLYSFHVRPIEEPNDNADKEMQ